MVLRSFPVWTLQECDLLAINLITKSAVSWFFGGVIWPRKSEEVGVSLGRDWYFPEIDLERFSAWIQKSAKASHGVEMCYLFTGQKAKIASKRNRGVSWTHTHTHTLTEHKQINRMCCWWLLWCKCWQCLPPHWYTLIETMFERLRAWTPVHLSDKSGKLPDDWIHVGLCFWPISESWKMGRKCQPANL